MHTVQINPLVVSINPIEHRLMSTTMLTPIAPTEHGGAIKKLIAVAAAILIPIAAPAITSAIGASGVLGSTISASIASSGVAATVGSTIVGAALGGVTAKVTGQNVGAGAIIGGFGGLLGGAVTAATTPGAGIPLVSGSEQLANIGAGTMPLSSATPATTGLQIGSNAPFTPAANVNTGATVTQAGLNTATNTTGQGVTSAVEPTVTAANTTGPGATSSVNTTGLSSAGTTAAGTTAAGTTAAGTAVAAGAGTGLLDKLGLSGFGKTAATAAAVSLVAGAIGDATKPSIEDLIDQGMSEAEAEAVVEYEAQLDELKESNIDAYNDQVEMAKQYLVQVGYYDPTYFAQQEANKMAIDLGTKFGEHQQQQALGSYTSDADARRFMLEGTQNIASAYDRGFMKGVGLQSQAIKDAAGLYPDYPTDHISYQKNLVDYHSAAADAAQQQQAAAAEAATGWATGLGYGLMMPDDEDEQETFMSAWKAGLNPTGSTTAKEA